jgi:arylformamidase
VNPQALIDITMTLDEGMLRWKDDPGPHFMMLHRVSDPFDANITAIWSALHTGTHIDVPAHVTEGAPGAESLKLQELCGPCRVVSIDDPRSVTVEELSRSDLSGVKRVLFKTRNSELLNLPKFSKDYVYLEKDAARWLVDQGVALVGWDYFSVDPIGYSDPSVHRILLGSGTLIMEGLDLRAVQPGAYDLWCFPLKLGRGDGAPVRVALSPRS